MPYTPPQRLNYFTCQLAVPNGHAAAVSLWTLITAYFLANRPTDAPNIYPSAKAYDIQCSSTSGSNVIISDYTAVTLTTSIGFELLPIGGLYQSPAGDTLSNDLQSVWVYAAGANGLINVQVRC